jgi:pyruvate,water dikinase
MYSALSTDGVKVPDGFALTAEAYRDALTHANAWGGLHRLLDGLDKSDVKLLENERHRRGRSSTPRPAPSACAR